MKRIIGLGLGLLLIPACWSIDTLDSDDVNEDAIHGEYAITYDAHDEDLRFYAQFRVGGSTGTTLRLSEPSEISVDGMTMDLFDGDEAWLNVEGSYYYLNEASVAPASEYSFVWTRRDGSTYENVVVMAPAIEIVSPMEGDSSSLSDGLTVQFDPPVGTGETVTCTIAGNSDIESEAVNSGTTCSFTAGELDQVEPGAATIWVRRRLDGEIQNGHDQEGGRIRSDYNSVKTQMVFTE